MENTSQKIDTKPVKRIVVLGGGFGGMQVVVDLDKKFASMDGYEILMIDKHEHFLFTPVLYEVATAYLPNKTAEFERKALERGACIRFDQFNGVVRGRRVSFRKTEITKIDGKAQVLHCANGETIPYEYLVIAAGTVADWPPIPGLKEHAVGLKTMADAHGMREHLKRFVTEHRAEGEDHISVVICGAGANGVELAGEAVNFFKHQVKNKSKGVSKYTVTLVEAGPKPLAVFDPTIAAWGLERLQKIGVEVIVNAMAVEMEHQSVTLKSDAFAGGLKKIHADIIIWAGGVRAPAFLAESGLPVDPKKGRILIDPQLRVQGFKNMYAIGDCTGLMNPKANVFYVQNAQVAEIMGKVTAENMYREVQGQPLEVFSCVWGEAVPICGKWGAFKIGNIRFRGFRGYILRQMINWYYFVRILPTGKAFAQWWSGWRLFIQND